MSSDIAKSEYSNCPELSTINYFSALPEGYGLSWHFACYTSGNDGSNPLLGVSGRSADRVFSAYVGAGLAGAAVEGA